MSVVLEKLFKIIIVYTPNKSGSAVISIGFAVDAAEPIIFTMYVAIGTNCGTIQQRIAAVKDNQCFIANLKLIA